MVLVRLRGVEANVLHCDIVVSGFDHQSRYYVHFYTNMFGTGMRPTTHLAMGQRVLPLFFKDGFF